MTATINSYNVENEELAYRIQQGQKEYIPQLWEQSKRLAYLQARKYYTEKKDLCTVAGVTLEDLEQQSYFAFVQAIEYYSPASGYKFLTFLRYPLQQEFNSITGMRTASGRKSIMRAAVRLEQPLTSEDEELTLEDITEDCTATQAFTDCIERIYQEELHEALQDCLDRLTERQRKVITCVYYGNMTRAEAAKEAGCKTTQATEAERKGLYTMRNGWCKRRLKEFAQDIITSKAMYHGGFTVWKNRGMSVPEYAVLRLEEEAEKNLLTRLHAREETY